MISIGINPITWSNDDLQHVGGNISLEQCLAEASGSGYAGVELGHKFPREPSQLKPLLDHHGLQLVSGWYSGRLMTRSASAEIEAMQNHASLLRDMGCEVLIFAEVTDCIHSARDLRLSQRPVMNASAWKELGARMSEVGKACPCWVTRCPGSARLRSRC